MLCYSNLGLPASWPFVDQCVLLRQFGFDGIEIALSPEHIAQPDRALLGKELAQTAREAGLAITCLHLGNPRLYADPNAPRWLHPDAAERAKHATLARDAFEIAESVGCPLVATASGAPRPQDDSNASWKLLLNGMKAALSAAPDSVCFLLEHEPEHFIRTTDQILELFDRTNGRVRCNLDIGHLEVAGEPLGESIRRLGAEIIRNVHLEDIKDRRHRHLLPGEGDIRFEEVRLALEEIKYDGPLTADLYPYSEASFRALASARDTFGSWR